MADDIIQVADGFWNIRGSFKIGGILDVGTHASLVRRDNGKYLFLDSYTLGEAEKRRVDEITRGGKDVEAILNLHPFHTVHVKAMHAHFPRARLHGTSRHLSRFPDLPWEETPIEDTAGQAAFAGEFDFAVPRGVDFISANENIHFSSVIALHRASQTIHSDDTLMYIRLPRLLRFTGLHDKVTFHMTLPQALEKRSGAAQDFKQWARELADRWKDAQNLCAAHTAPLLGRENSGAPVSARILGALDKVEKTLRAHERKYG
ncbi:MAG: hypothetical protein QM820_26050 [Minicystis sp.]